MCFYCLVRIPTRFLSPSRFVCVNKNGHTVECVCVCLCRLTVAAAKLSESRLAPIPSITIIRIFHRSHRYKHSLLLSCRLAERRGCVILLLPLASYTHTHTHTHRSTHLYMHMKTCMLGGKVESLRSNSCLICSCHPQLHSNTHICSTKTYSSLFSETIEDRQTSFCL